MKINTSQISMLLEQTLSNRFNVNTKDASNQQLYKSSVIVLLDILQDKYIKFYKKNLAENNKQVCYLCMEFLMGRSLRNTLFNLDLEEQFKQVFEKYGVSLENIYENESDAALGNGGLGRLAACFLDSLAFEEIPTYGYSILYEFGIFKQKLINGWQSELPDNWLAGGNVWLKQRPEDAVEVRFDGYIEEHWGSSIHKVEHKDYVPVYAVPYDLMVAGYNGNGVSILRLFSAKAPGLNMKLFNEGDYLKAMEQNAMAEVISKVLYPSDNHIEGKSLRLKQQYFLVCASISDIINRHLKKHDLKLLPEKAAIHINDTHPALAIPELMRVLMDDCGFGWDEAWDIVTRTIAYTNHTVMSEALECWPVDLIKARLPRIFQIIQEIDNRSRREIWLKTENVDFVERTAVISNGVIRMANLSIVGSHSVNGVSKLHSQILKDSVFNDFYSLYPERFTNVTNGIAYRRWLCQSNPGLTDLLDQTIGDGYKSDATKLSELEKYIDDKSVLNRLSEVKLENKQRLADYIKKAQNISVDPNSIFDVQAKRLHEYKRQHLNALHILEDYLTIKANPNGNFQPKTYLFAAKAAPGYILAKEIIQLIINIAKLINSDPQTKGLLKAVFLEDYRVTLAEILLPAAEISEQISLAGTEASGTGNMKLMINGAITLGTDDGANVEIKEAVGEENILIFGMTTDQAKAAKQFYNPYDIYNNSPIIRELIDMLRNPRSGVESQTIASSLLNSDPYMVLKDFDSYSKAHSYANQLYNDHDKWNQMSLVNIARAGIFSSDRSIKDYAQNIWQIK